jgi:hypothetical protein
MKIEIKTDQALWKKQLEKHGGKGYSDSFQQQTLQKLWTYREGEVYILTGNNTEGFDKDKPSGTGYVLRVGSDPALESTALGSCSFSSLQIGRCARISEKIRGKDIEFLMLGPKPDPKVPKNRPW